MNNQHIVRRATWIELFFDLIFVVAIAKAAHVLVYVKDGQLDMVTYLKYMLIIIPVWWAWTGATLYSNRFATDSILQRMLTFVQMFFVIILAANINVDFDTYYQGFLLSYAAIRLLTVIMYIRTSVMNINARPISNFLALAFGIGILISLSSLLFDGVLRYTVLYAGIAFEMLMPVLAKERMQTTAVNTHHLPERFGLLAIILLGESVLSLSKSFEQLDWSLLALTMAASGFIMVCGLWWLYFDNIERRISGQTLGHGQAIIYSHLLIYAGLGGLAAMIQFAVIPELSLSAFKQLSGFAILGFMVALQFLHYVYHPGDIRKFLLRNAALFNISFLVLMVFAPSIPVIMIATTVLVIAYAALDQYCTRTIGNDG